MRIRTKKFQKDSFFIIAEIQKQWFIFKYWVEVDRVLIEISDFWDFGGFHSQGGPMYMKPMLMTTQINYASYDTEVWKPCQFDLNKRIDEYEKEITHKVNRQLQCELEVSKFL